MESFIFWNTAPRIMNTWSCIWEDRTPRSYSSGSLKSSAVTVWRALSSGIQHRVFWIHETVSQKTELPGATALEASNLTQCYCNSYSVSVKNLLLQHRFSVNFVRHKIHVSHCRCVRNSFIYKWRFVNTLHTRFRMRTSTGSSDIAIKLKFQKNITKPPCWYFILYK
jgi:hypothetical protein